jgi:hypothetical protein
VIERSRRQFHLSDGLIAEEVGDLWEGWMRGVDELLDDAQLLELVYEALARRWTHSRTLGRKGTPADVLLRLLVLKHMRNWSYAALEREVRANLTALERVHEERFEPTHGPLRAAARRAVGRFLDCGLLEHGFARVRCDAGRASSLWRSGARGGTSVRRATRGDWPSGACGWTSGCSPRWRTGRWC